MVAEGPLLLIDERVEGNEVEDIDTAVLNDQDSKSPFAKLNEQNITRPVA